MKYKVLLFTLMQGCLQLHGQVRIAGNMQIGSQETFATPADVNIEGDLYGTGYLLLNKLSGPSQKLDASGHVIPALHVNAASNIALVSDVQIGEGLLFSGGKINLGDAGLSFQTGATQTGADAEKYIVSDGQGMVKAAIDQNTSFIFPVGSSLAAGDYTPVHISNNAANRIISVQVKDYDNAGATVYNRNSGIDRAWYIASDVAGEAVVTLTHNVSTEALGFDRDAAFVTQQMADNGMRWSIGAPSGGMQHTGVFTIPAGISPMTYFSKSSNTDSSLGRFYTSIVPRSDENIVLRTTVYPNPFIDQAKLRIESDGSIALQYRLTDITGRLINTGELAVHEGIQTIHLPVAGLSAGIYQVHLAHEAGPLSTIQIVKK